MSEVCLQNLYKEKLFPLRSSKFAPRELFGPESLGGTPTDITGDLSHLDELFFDHSINPEDPASFDYSGDSNNQNSLIEWEVVIEIQLEI